MTLKNEGEYLIDELWNDMEFNLEYLDEQPISQIHKKNELIWSLSVKGFLSMLSAPRLVSLETYSRPMIFPNLRLVSLPYP